MNEPALIAIKNEMPPVRVLKPRGITMAVKFWLAVKILIWQGPVLILMEASILRVDLRVMSV